ncbi:MAG: CARDB domain-containing protein, partial [Thermoplasmata archaeon]
MYKAIRKSGVSSVIGSFLILVITVVLFSTIFAWVQTSFPTPPPRANSDFKADEPWYENTPGGYYAHVNLTYVSGEDIVSQHLLILLLFEDGTRYSLSPADGGISTQYWHVGDCWRWKSTSLFTQPQNLTVQIIHTIKNILLWQEVKVVNNIWYPPNIAGVGTNPSPVTAGAIFRVWAEIYDNDINPDSVYADLTRLGLGVIKLNRISESRFESADIVANVGADTYTCVLNATDYAGHPSIKSFTVTVVLGSQEVALPKLIVSRISLNPGSPTRGETVFITATIKNLASTAASSAIIYVNDTFVSTTATSNLDVQCISVPGYGETEIFTTWIAQPGGEHVISYSITDVYPGNIQGTGGSVGVTVMPRLLLVDDDGWGAGTPWDMGANFVAALNSINVNYTLATVPQNASGPAYDIGPAQYQLRNFDVVIWEGGLTNNTLTSADVSNLQRFLDGGGKLWLAGANILENVSTTFLSTYLGISGVQPQISLPTRIYGTDYGSGWINASNLKPYINPLVFTNTRPLNIPFSTPLLVNESGEIKFANQFKRQVGGFESRVVVLSMEFGAFKETGDQAILAYLVVNWLSGITARTGDDLAVAGQEISTLTPRYREPINVSAVIRNNGDVSHTNATNGSVEVQLIVYYEGIEVAREWPISGQTIELEAFGDSKRVNFTWTPPFVGIFVLSVMVDPYNKIAEVNERNNVYNNTLFLNQINVIYTMLVVDDDSSANNNGTLPDTTSEILSALQSLGYTLGKDMDLQVVEKGKDRNNSEYNISRYNCVIWNTGLSYGAGGYNTLTANDINILQNYYLTDSPAQHSVIIMGAYILNDSVVANTPFMRNILGANTTGSPTSYIGNQIIYGVREGQISNGLEFQMSNTSFASFSARAYNKTENALPIFWADAINHWERQSDNVLGSAVFDPSGWHACYLAFNLAYTANRTMIAEIMLSMVHWCGRIEGKPEIKITAPDIYAATHYRPYIYLRELNPQVGSSYLLKINITNLGGMNASVSVRFLDGDTIIGSRNVNVPPSTVNESGYVSNGKAVSEVIWVPLFAGFETIRVMADPEGIYGSAEFIRANNNASQQIQVFFFYDDMEVPERTAQNWNHDATLLNINGESPLDFLPRKDVSTRVIGDWDWELSGSVNKSGTVYGGAGIYYTNDSAVFNYTKGAAHTPSTAYWLPEVPNLPGITGERKPMDLYLVIDNSGSMAEDPDGDGKTKWDDLVSAVSNVILPNLTASDNITLIAFGDKNTINLDENVFWDMNVSRNRYNSDLKTDNNASESVHIWVNRSSVTDATKNTILSYLTNPALGMSPLGTTYYTPIWDAIGVGIAYARYYNHTVDNANGIIPAVIVLSDGMDWGKYRGNGGKVGETLVPKGNAGPDGGSEFFGPWRAWDLQDQEILGEVTPIGRDFDPDNENWWPVEFSNGDRTRWGLIETINSTDVWVHVPVYTVGLGVAHFEHPSLGKLDTNHYGQEAGTQEYWLWKIASTSAAKFSNAGYDGYFYASQSSQLSQIFTSILGAIGGTGDIRIPPPVPPAPKFILGNAINAVSTTTLFYDGFESGLTQWT